MIEPATSRWLSPLEFSEPTSITVTMCVLPGNSEWIFGTYKLNADELRWEVRQALEKSKPPKPNISKTERQALKSPQDDNSIIILPADKGDATMVMDRVE